MEVKPGYKQTEVGVIPEDWDVNTLGKTIYLQAGFSFSSKDYSNDGVNLIKISNVSFGKIVWDDLTSLPKDYLQIFSNFSINSGDIIMAMTRPVVSGGIKVARASSTDIPSLLNQRVCRFITNEKTSQDYIYHCLFSTRFIRYISDLSFGSQQPNLSSKDIEKNNIPFPPLPEQTAIATALSDVDALISGLDRLIEKKRAIKQAAMQELLTGKRRLPGFDSGKGYKQTEVGGIPEDWEINKIGHISVIDPENLPSNTDPNYTFNYISLEDVDYGRLLSFKELIFSDSPSRARRKIKLGDILFSTVRPNLKSHLFFKYKSNGFICSTGFSVVRCDEKLINPKYLYFHLFGTIIEKQIDALITGSNYPAINSSDVKSINLPIPPLPEQTAIATVLSDMDTEISALEARRAKTLSLKQGMMQELLTGRIRLV